MSWWKKKFLSSLTLLALLLPLGKVYSNQQGADCVHCGKTGIRVSFEGTNVEVINTSINQITHMMSSSRGQGKVVSQKDSNYMCLIVANPVENKEENIKMFHTVVDQLKERYQVDDFMQIYNSIRCVGGVSLLSSTMLYGNRSVALELFKMRVPVNTVNEYGETELDFYLKMARAVRKNGVGNLKDISFFTRVFRGNKRSYDVPLLTCEIEGTCTCPFALPQLGLECTPSQG